MHTSKYLLLALTNFAGISALAGKPSRTPTSFTATEIFSFPPTNPVFIENIFVLPDNRLLLSHFGGPGPDSPLYILNQTSAQVSIVGSLPNSTAQTGIAALGGDRYAITAGVVGDNFEFIEGSVNVFIISLPNGSGTASVVDAIPVGNTINMNGLVSLPSPSGDRHILLSADSRGGRILRIDTQTRTSSVAFTDPLFGRDPNNVDAGSIAITGVNGLSLRGSCLYFSNSAQGIVGVVKINDLGYRAGDAKVLSRIRGNVTLENFFDDLAVDRRGNAYVAWETRTLVKVAKVSGRQTVILGPGGVSNGNVTLRYPTAVKVGLSGEEVYVATGGILDNGDMLGGQVVKVQI
ncbi:hypothetical protein MFIFM68171_07006 [Madurella fahalii]|uniref:SMP-30/Gluconolactonase/LRE-like region domain-containing protein n=1 Tax=Madurella fahalii TaxID=1157608 RepID=A0ABQ0GGB5_9PEZI